MYLSIIKNKINNFEGILNESFSIGDLEKYNET